jgi:preprotein translocase SecE subunit
VKPAEGFLQRVPPASMDSVINYFRDSVRELELVRWPTRQQAVRLSVIVIGFTILSAAAFGAMDYLLKSLLYLFLMYTI